MAGDDESLAQWSRDSWTWGQRVVWLKFLLYLTSNF